MDYLEICGTFVGLLYLWLEYRASVYLWLASIVMPAIYIFVYYRVGLYADFGINIYYLLAALYGWYKWKYGNKTENGAGKQPVGELPVSRMPLHYYLPSTFVFIFLFVAIGYILLFFTDSRNDLPLAERAGYTVCVNPDAVLESAARKNGWKVAEWKLSLRTQMTAQVNAKGVPETQTVRS